jgi:ferredoxin
MHDIIAEVVETMFRFFPFPTKTGLRTVGRPGPEDAVLVTCNFDLTVRRVQRALRGTHCFLLVAPSKGINVWCAAGGGILTAHSVTSVIKTSRIGEKVSHRRLILPQLSAPGIDPRRIEQETGWRCEFGPVYARDIPEYLASNSKTPAMSRVRFPLKDRLEMAAMWATPMSLLVAIPLVFLGARLLPGALALIWAFTLVLYTFYEPVMCWVPGGLGLVKTALMGLVGALCVTVYGVAVGGWQVASIVGWDASIMAVALVLGFDLDGTSPLRAGSTVAYWGRKWPKTLEAWRRFGFDLEEWFTLEVDPETCVGCTTCVKVCPKGVFESYEADGQQKSRVARAGACEQCTACVKQCPSGAILSEPPVKTFRAVVRSTTS